MLTFFLPPMRTNNDAVFRIRYIEDINRRIFQLVYLSNFTFQDCESMTSLELKWFYSELRRTKDAEREAQEEAMRKAKEARQTKSVNSTHRPVKRR